MTAAQSLAGIPKLRRDLCKILLRRCRAGEELSVGWPKIIVEMIHGRLGFGSRKPISMLFLPSSPHFVYRILFLRGNQTLVGRLTVGVRNMNPCVAALRSR
ncbi:hypothetical protein PMIN02_010427 [Paraphaeosphaeria minitans]